MIENISKKKLIALLRSGDYNFVAGGITPLHKLGVQVALSYLKEKGIPIKGIVLQAPHPQTGYVGDWNLSPNYPVKVFQFSPFNTKIRDKIFTIYYKIGKLIRLLMLRYKKHEDGNTIYIVKVDRVNSEYYTDFPLKDKRIYIIHDEGLSSYIGFPPTPLHTYKWGYYINAFLNHATESIFNQIDKEIIDLRMFRFSKNQLIPNESAIKLYDAVYKSIYIPTDYNIDIFENAVIICTNMLSDSTHDKENIVAVLQNVQEICIRKNIPFILKPHPRENIQRYQNAGLNVYTNNQYPMEVIITHLEKKPKCIISFYSTLLLEAKYIWNINAYSLLGLVNYTAWDDEEKYLSKEFVRMFKNSITITNSINQIEL